CSSPAWASAPCSSASCAEPHQVAPRSLSATWAPAAPCRDVAACSVRRVSSREVVSAFWAAMQANDWEKASGYLAPGCVVDWPCSGERIVGRSNFVAIQAQYPTATGRWDFDVHRLVADGDTVVSEVTVTDGEQSARVVAFSEVDSEHVVH